MKSWYLIHTKPSQEKLAQEHLERQGFKTYLPLATLRRRRRGRSIQVIEAMFPRYLFIYLSDETDDWRPIRSTIGVSGMVRFGQVPARVPESLINDLHNREDESGLHDLSSPEYRPGETVRIAEGAMKGYEGIYHSRTGKDRVVILLEIANKYVRVELQASQIDPAQ